jgi:hypothetical protein
VIKGRTVNDIILVVHPIRIVSDKTDMDKVLFSLGHRIWVWIRKNFVNLSGMNMGKGFSLPVIHWVNYIYIERERESDYSALQITEVLCALRSIFNFNSEIIDPNRSI